MERCKTCSNCTSENLGNFDCPFCNIQIGDEIRYDHDCDKYKPMSFKERQDEIKEYILNNITIRV